MDVNSTFEKTGIKCKVLQEIIQLAKKNCVEKVILFGSRARGDFKERSDIDLAFCGGSSSHFILDVDETTSTLLEFDIVDLDKPVRKELLESIKREGVVLYEKKMISDEELWLDALVSRNNVAHAYNQAIAMDIIRQTKEKYYDMFIQLEKKIEQDWLWQRKQRLQMINLIL